MAHQIGSDEKSKGPENSQLDFFQFDLELLRQTLHKKLSGPL